MSDNIPLEETSDFQEKDDHVDRALVSYSQVVSAADSTAWALTSVKSSSTSSLTATPLAVTGISSEPVLVKSEHPSSISKLDSKFSLLERLESTIRTNMPQSEYKPTVRVSVAPSLDSFKSIRPFEDEVQSEDPKFLPQEIKDYTSAEENDNEDVGSSEASLKSGPLSPSSFDKSGMMFQGNLINTTSISRQLATIGKLESASSNISETKEIWKSRSNSIVGLDLSPATARRNQEFHAMFRSVPEDDILIDDYSCALQKDILIQGRLYLSRDHICFNSNIFGWITNIVINLADILSVERKMTAFVIPNAILVTTLRSKYMFTSFMHREHAYVSIVRLWRSAMGDEVDGIPQSLIKTSPVEQTSDQRDTLNVVRDNSPSRSPRSPRHTRSSSEAKNKKSFLSDGENNKHVNSSNRPPLMPQLSKGFDSDAGGSLSDGAVMDSGRKKKKANLKFLYEKAKQREVAEESNGYEQDDELLFQANKEEKKSRKSKPSGKKGSDSKKAFEKSVSSHEMKRKTIANIPKSFPKPPVYCNCNDHCKIILVDLTFPVSLSNLASILYGSPAFFEKVFISRGLTHVKFSQWEKSVDSNGKKMETRQLEYNFPMKIPPINYSAKCHVLQKYTRKDSNQVICVREVTSVPTVGSLISVLTSQCLMRVNDNESRLMVGWEVNMGKTANSFLKLPVEKALYENSKSHWKLFEQMLLYDSKVFYENLLEKENAANSKDIAQVLSLNKKEENDFAKAWKIFSEKIVSYLPYIFMVMIFVGIVMLREVKRLDHLVKESGSILEPNRYVEVGLNSKVEFPEEEEAFEDYSNWEKYVFQKRIETLKRIENLEKDLESVDTLLKEFVDELN